MNATITSTFDEASAASIDAGGFGGHPRGLTTLFFTEMWERFSYYGMRAILLLYMVAPVAAGGLGFDTVRATSIYGTYTMSVYLTALPGGFIADRFLGLRRAVLIGGIIIAIGHFSMAFSGISFFYGGLILIALGTGLLKPNISGLVGSLYAEGDARRDGGFSIFYMGINIGAFIAPLVCGYLAQGEGFKSFLASSGFNPQASWHWGFAAAGIGMTLGLAQFVLFRQRLPNDNERSNQLDNQLDYQSNDARLELDNQTNEGRDVENSKLTVVEWKRIGAILIFFSFTALFWSIYEQAGSSLNLFADRLTRTEIFGFAFPSSWFQSVPALFVIALAPVFSVLWLRMGKRQPSSPAKFMFGLLFLGLGTLLMIPASLLAAQGRVSPVWLLGVYFLHVVGELCLSPVGLSTVTKLAPIKLVGLMLGVWFLASALGNKIAGALAGMFDENDIDSLLTLFGGMGVAAIVATVILALLTPTIRRLMGGVR